jgi:hypothetical protein
LTRIVSRVSAGRAWRLILLVIGLMLVVVVGERPASPRVRLAAARCPVLATASRSEVGAAGKAPQTFALFRRRRTGLDQLPPSQNRLASEISYQLKSFDPTLIREVTAPPLQRLHARIPGRLVSFVVVGQGAAPEFTLKGQSCARRLSPADRRQLEHGLAARRAITPSGPSFCFVTVATVGSHPGYTHLGGICDTFANAEGGYGANEIGLEVAALASIVPDGVATVVLHYSGHAAIRAPVTDNVYWVGVPRLPPLGGGPGVHASMRTLRAFIRKSLPRRTDWLASTGRTLRTFAPPAAYVRLLIRRYQACVELGCGA